MEYPNETSIDREPTAKKEIDTRRLRQTPNSSSTVKQSHGGITGN